MNKLEEIESFLQADTNIETDSTFLLSYIPTFLYKSSNREKIQQYYKNIPAIFDKIFGLSSKTNYLKQYSRSSQCLVDSLNSEKTTFEKLDLLLHLVWPQEIRSFKNLYSSVSHPPDHIPDYLLTASIISKSINALVSQKKQEYILSLGIFSELQRDTRASLERGNLELTIFEYFIIFLLISIKELSPLMKNKVYLPKINKNFEDFPRSYSNKKLFTEKSKEFLFMLDLNKSLVYNFYLIFIKTLLQNLASSKYMSDYKKLKFLISAVEFVWLSDYFMIPQSNYITKSPLEIYTFFFNYNTYPISLGVPNLILLDCLMNVILTLQGNGLLFSENIHNKQIILKEDALLFSLQKSLFYFFKSCFLKFSEESGSMEVSLSDIANIWFTYITPWMQSNFSSYISGKNININSNRTLNQHNILQSSNLKSYINSRSFTNVNHHHHENSYDGAVMEYIYANLLFYTELFNDYISAFSSLNVLNKNELSSLSKILELFKLNREGEIINGYVQMKVLEDLSLGKIFVILYFKYILKNLKYILELFIITRSRQPC
jgi:hypothetical protein